jgi:hypothetical protein
MQTASANTWENSPTAGGQEKGKSITANNGNLSVGVNYHYIAEYTGDRFKAYITDDNGNVVQNIADTTDSTFLGRLSNIGPNGPNHPNVTVGSIKIGDDDGHYYFKGLEYRNITFFSGDAQNVWTPIASTDFTSLPNAIEGNLGYLDTYNQASNPAILITLAALAFTATAKLISTAISPIPAISLQRATFFQPSTSPITQELISLQTVRLTPAAY